MIRFRNFSGLAGVAMEQQGEPVYPRQQKDQRRNLRVPLIVEKFPCRDGRRTFFGYAGNISRGGLFVATVSPREPGEQFELQITLPPPAGFSLRCHCEVVWKRHFARQGKYGPGMGLRFLDLSPEQGEALERWLAEAAGRVP